MRLNKFDRNVLFNLKKSEGLDEESARWEVERDQATQDNIILDFRDLKKQIRHLTKENNELRKLVNKNIIPKESKKITKNDISCSVKYLNRILNYLNDNPNSTQSNIVLDCGMSGDLVKEGLLFLTNKKLIIKQVIKGRTIYATNNNPK